MMEEEKIKYWKERWENNNTTWHKTEVNPELLKFSQLLLFKTPATVFLPLCGKSLDLEWIYKLGHKVIGIEATEFVVRQFFEEREIPFEKLQLVDSGVDIIKYESSDHQLIIYVGNLFTFPPALLGKIDAIWDRGSLVAIHKEDRARYACFIRSILSEDFRILLDAIEYDESKYDGPPRVITKHVVESLYGQFCNYEIMEEIDRSEDAVRKNPNLTWMKSIIYIFTPKLL